MVTMLDSIFFQLKAIGIHDIILPFLLIFVIVYAILQKVKVFGKDGKKTNLVIALVMGLAVVFPHALGMYPPGRDIVNIINTSLPNVSIIIVAILMALIIIGLLGKRVELGNNTLSGWIAFLAFAVVLYIFGSSAGWFGRRASSNFLTRNPDLTALVITILIFAVIIWFITKDDKQKEDKFEFGKEFSKLLKGGED